MMLLVCRVLPRCHRNTRRRDADVRDGTIGPRLPVEEMLRRWIWRPRSSRRRRDRGRQAILTTERNRRPQFMTSRSAVLVTIGGMAKAPG